MAPFPVVILAHTCGGNGPYTLDWAARLTSAGYAVLAVDSNTPRGTLNNCNAEGRVTSDDMVLDVAAAIAHLRGVPAVTADRVGVMGFSFGGGAVLRIASAAYRRKLGADVSAVRAVASLYPPCRNPHPSPVTARNWHNLYDDITIPTVVLLGALDTETIPGYCTTPIDRLRKRGQPIRYTLFADTTHGFDMSNMGLDGQVRPGGHLYRYSPDATEAAWREVKALFDRELMTTH
jgi:dienelactone hydrolase